MAFCQAQKDNHGHLIINFQSNSVSQQSDWLLLNLGYQHSHDDAHTQSLSFFSLFGLCFSCRNLFIQEYLFLLSWRVT